MTKAYLNCDDYRDYAWWLLGKQQRRVRGYVGSLLKKSVLKLQQGEQLVPDSIRVDIEDNVDGILVALLERFDDQHLKRIHARYVQFHDDVNELDVIDDILACAYRETTRYVRDWSRARAKEFSNRHAETYTAKRRDKARWQTREEIAHWTLKPAEQLAAMTDQTTLQVEIVQCMAQHTGDWVDTKDGPVPIQSPALRKFACDTFGLDAKQVSRNLAKFESHLVEQFTSVETHLTFRDWILAVMRSESEPVVGATRCHRNENILAVEVAREPYRVACVPDIFAKQQPTTIRAVPHRPVYDLPVLNRWTMSVVEQPQPTITNQFNWFAHYREDSFTLVDENDRLLVATRC